MSLFLANPADRFAVGPEGFAREASERVGVEGRRPPMQPAAGDSL
jgi:hypothetical protein